MYRDSATFAQKSTFEPQVTSPASLHLLGYLLFGKKQALPLTYHPHTHIGHPNMLKHVCFPVRERGGQNATFKNPTTCRSCELNSSPQGWQQVPLPVESPSSLFHLLVSLYLKRKSQQEILQKNKHVSPHPEDLVANILLLSSLRVCPSTRDSC